MRAFLEVYILLFIVKSLLTYSTSQPHPTSSPFKTKGFLLFGELAYLCDDVLATGVGDFGALEWDQGIYLGKAQWRRRESRRSRGRGRMS